MSSETATLGTVSTNEAPLTPQPLPPHEAPVKHAWPGSGQPSAGETKHTADQFRISGLDDAALEAMLEAECKFAFVSVRSPSASRPALIAPPSPRPRISSSLRCGLCHATEDQGAAAAAAPSSLLSLPHSIRRPPRPSAAPLANGESARGAEERPGARETRGKYSVA